MALHRMQKHFPRGFFQYVVKESSPTQKQWHRALQQLQRKIRSRTARDVTQFCGQHTKKNKENMSIVRGSEMPVCAGMVREERKEDS